ncbi:unnamed protein product [Macrosiphum euphorbiae]|uniref:Uncharacterized protein n=1 Tax=Macrosiphum euphorbiae TaxID=13131 RepID=A0AAV0VQP6_9HEMI|nr:unnamed protein product [Macrosiphum euphorbiae]
MQEHTILTCIGMLFDYYERYWLRNVGVELLSVYKKVYRTNNNIESFHNKLKQTFQVSHPNIWAFLGNLCKINTNYLIKLNQLENGLALTRNMKSKYITNDSRIRTASRQLRQGRLSIKSFLLRCSFSVAGYEERMRFMALGQNNIEPLLMNDDEPANNVEEPVVNEGVHNINADNLFDIGSDNSDIMVFVRRRRRIFSITDDESENESNRYDVENLEVPQHEPLINIFDEFRTEYNRELDLQGVEPVVDENNVDVDVDMLLDNDPGNIN